PRRWLRWLGGVAFLAVVLQGVLGGLRVALLKDEIGIFHAALAQSFFVLVVLLALFISGCSGKIAASIQTPRISPRLHWLTVGGTILIFTQLILGATMRHQHAGLAVPDFPLAYGRIWPPMNSFALERINSEQPDRDQRKSITAFHIAIHMTHRLVALSIVFLV